MANAKLTIKIWDVWIENDKVCGVYEILEINKIIYAERELNDIK